MPGPTLALPLPPAPGPAPTVAAALPAGASPAVAPTTTPGSFADLLASLLPATPAPPAPTTAPQALPQQLPTLASTAVSTQPVAQTPPSVSVPQSGNSSQPPSLPLANLSEVKSPPMHASATRLPPALPTAPTATASLPSPAPVVAANANAQSPAPALPAVATNQPSTTTDQTASATTASSNVALAEPPAPRAPTASASPSPSQSPRSRTATSNNAPEKTAAATPLPTSDASNLTLTAIASTLPPSAPPCSGLPPADPTQGAASLTAAAPPSARLTGNIAGAAPPLHAQISPAASAAPPSPPPEPAAISAAQKTTENIISASAQPPPSQPNAAPLAQAGDLLALPQNTPQLAVDPSRAMASAPPSPAIPPEHVATQLAPAMVQVTSSDTSQRVSVALNPQSLGHVVVSVERPADGEMKITLTASRPETLALLQQGSAQLVHALDRAGITAQPHNIAFHLAPSPSGASAQGDSAQRQASGGQAGGHPFGTASSDTGQSGSFSQQNGGQTRSTTTTYALALPVDDAMPDDTIAAIPQPGSARGIDITA